VAPNRFGWRWDELGQQLGERNKQGSLAQLQPSVRLKSCGKVCEDMKKSGNDKKVAKNVTKALAEVPIDNKQERDALRARLRQKYDDLERLRSGMKEDDRKRFDEIGELIDELDECESRATLPRT
jgi:hypothetical protein